MKTTSKRIVSTVLGVLTLCAGASGQSGDSADARRSKIDSLVTLYNKAVNKAGIAFDGEFRSEFMSSGIDGIRSDSSRPSQENIAYNTVDLDLHARPHMAAQGRLIFRLHTDWRDVWSASKPAYFTRWISIDGRVKDMVGYSVGKYTQKLTPLTLYSPQLDVMYEPAIFALDRKMAMEEEFLGDHERVLQGVKATFDSQISNRLGVTLVDALHLNAFGSRLRQPLIPNDDSYKGINAYLGTGFEKFLAGGDAQATFLKGVSVGGTYLSLFDRENGIRSLDSAKLAAIVATARGDSVRRGYLLDSALNLSELQNTTIAGFRVGVRIDSIVDAFFWRAGASVEFANADNAPKAHPDLKADSTLLAMIRSTSGKALSIKALGGFDYLSLSVDASVGYLANDPDYRNELAQSPNFVGMRIMNIENDAAWGATGMPSRFRTPQYTTFDALYRHAFRFAPKSTSYANLSTLEPYTKNSYTNAIMTQRELAALESSGLLDPSVQLVMPYGPATPNRTGIDGSLSARILDSAIELNSIFSSLNEVEPVLDSLPKTKFNQYGFGGSIDVGAIIRWRYPLKIYGSYVASSAENAPEKLSSSFVNAGANITVLKRTSLLGGFQMIENSMTGTVTHSETQTNMAAGVEYRFAKDSYVLGKVARVVSDDPSTPEDDLKQTLVYAGMRVVF